MDRAPSYRGAEAATARLELQGVALHEECQGRLPAPASKSGREDSHW